MAGMDESNLVQIDRVRCLECGVKYVKPAEGGTAHRNPGCPRCGYVGWILATIPPSSSGIEPRGLRAHAR